MHRCWRRWRRLSRLQSSPTATTTMKIAGIIVNYRTAELTAQATNALLGDLARVGSSHLFVVDNDSRDGSYESLRAAAKRDGWAERVTIIAAPRNGGYGYGINLAVRQALALV